jgi:hypothetical protein
MRALLAAFLSVFWVSLPVHAQSNRGGGDDFYGRKFALVIGNGNYERAELKNPANDAEDLAEALRKTGFRVSRHLNADLATMRLALAEFEKALPDNAAAFVFYAGHGVQYQGQNYLIPVGAMDKIKTASDLPRHAFALAEITSQLASRRKGITIIVLDACRDSPFMDVEGIESGLSRSIGLRNLKADDTSQKKKAGGGLEGVLVAYSTAPDSTARDGDGRNSPYTQHFKEFLRRPNASLETVLKMTRVEVTTATKGQQTPWYESSISGDFYAAGRGRIEFDDLLRVLTGNPDWNPADNDVIAWKSASPVFSGKETSNFRDASGKMIPVSFSRSGSVVVTIGGEPMHFGRDESKPAPWNITLIGPRAGVDLISIKSSVRPFTGGDGEIFTGSPLLKELVRCKRSSSSAGLVESRVFAIAIDERKAWLYEGRRCAASSCETEYYILNWEHDLPRFGCAAG